MTNEFEPIYANVYNPKKSLLGSSKSDKAECFVYSCALKSCPLRAENKCVNSVFTSCPYGKIRRETGFTGRARKFNEWIRER